MSDKPVPTPSEDTGRFWDACNDGRFVVQRCTDCGTELFYPAAACPNCWNTDFDDVELNGNGTVESFTVVHRAPTDAFEGETPYVVALVTMGTENDVTVMANVLANPGDVSVGDSVTMTWEERNGQQLYQFELAE
ncbi:Zn-ribbon domain-containing OB-fold protein [Natrinema gelatinilyticum]|uniref:Zn-ribbon domain-containing OB-fold protein n=1 Tax=Natrinema gelatinilyticum TaxID=2961571 RepID=UPI0020C20A84|nr:Zn-ribbon domain-containing OB-fold protein [Natrinema gelatinilyticum]